MANALNTAIAAIDKKYYAIIETAKIELGRLAAQYKIEKQKPRLEQTRDTKDAYENLQHDCNYKYRQDWYNETKKAHLRLVKFQFENRVFNCFNAHPHTVSQIEVFPEFKTDGYTTFEGRFTETVNCAPYQGGFLTPSGEYFNFRTHSGDVYKEAYAKIDIVTNTYIATPFWDMQRNDACDAVSFGYIHQHENAR